MLNLGLRTSIYCVDFSAYDISIRVTNDLHLFLVSRGKIFPLHSAMADEVLCSSFLTRVLCARFRLSTATYYVFPLEISPRFCGSLVRMMPITPCIMATLSRVT